jgi:hypothetical protein
MSFVDSISTRPESNFGIKELPLHHGNVSYRPSRSFDSKDPNNIINASSGALGSGSLDGSGINEVKFDYNYDGSGALAGYRESGGYGALSPPGGLVAGPQIARPGREKSQYYPSQYQSQRQNHIENSSYRTRSDSEPRSEWSTGAWENVSGLVGDARRGYWVTR